MAETSNTPVEALIGLIRSQLLDVNTAIPGVIVSYENGKANVLPTGKKRFADGDALDYPVIQGVRVCWPSFAGGAAGVKGPVKKGDRCLLVFSQQAVDGTDDRRMFDLQDAYALMTDLGNSGAGDSANNNSMTMFFGPAFFRIHEDGSMEISAPGGINVVSGAQVTVEASANIAMNTSAGLAINAVTGSSFTGTLTQTGGELSSNGVVLDSHVHSGVQPGTGTSGPPV